MLHNDAALRTFWQHGFRKKYHFINHLGVYMMVTVGGIHDLSHENSGSVAVIPRQ